MITCVFVFILCLGFLFFIKAVPFYRNSGLALQWLAVLFLLKVAAGLFAYYLYSFHPLFSDSSDALKYFRDGKTLYESAFRKPGVFFSLFTGIPLTGIDDGGTRELLISWNRVYETLPFNTNRLMVRYNTLLCFVSGASYPIHSVITNMLSFTGLIGIFRFLKSRSGSNSHTWPVLILFLLPSLLFWGSVVSKEALGLAALGMVLTSLTMFERKHKRIPALILLVLGLILLTAVKIHLGLLVFVFLFPYFYITTHPRMHVVKAYLFSIVCLLLGGLILLSVFPDNNPLTWLHRQQMDFYSYQRSTGTLTLLNKWVVSGNITGLLLKSPLAVLQALLGPVIPTKWTLFTMLAMAENIILILFPVIWAVRRENISFSGSHFYLILFLALADLYLIGSSTPNGGAIQRYRILTLPLLLVMMAPVRMSRFFPDFSKPIFSKIHFYD